MITCLHLHRQLSLQQAPGGGNKHLCQRGTRACHITPARGRFSGPCLLAPTKCQTLCQALENHHKMGSPVPA